MNKQELSSHLKQATENIDDILKAAELPLDLPDYSPEQVKVLEEIVKLISTKQTKTYKEAGEVYRKPINEHQLQEIALRYCQTERIAEITAALKLKLGSMNEEQFAAFQSVCEQVQQGMDLDMVAQAALDQAKASKSKKTPAQPEFTPPPEPTSAIAQTNGRNGSAIAQTPAQENEDAFGLGVLPEPMVKDLRELAKIEFDQKHDGLVANAANGILDEMDNLSDAAHQVGRNIAREAISNGMAAAAHTGATKRVIEEVKRQRRPK